MLKKWWYKLMAEVSQGFHPGRCVDTQLPGGYTLRVGCTCMGAGVHCMDIAVPEYLRHTHHSKPSGLYCGMPWPLSACYPMCALAHTTQ